MNNLCRAGACPKAVQIGDPIERSMRLRRPDLRKASGFPANVTTRFSSEPAGRLSLPAGSEEVLQDARPTGRQSLPARQAAEPQVVADRIEGNLDKPGVCPGQRPSRKLLTENIYEQP
jgi:hypothetical protein